VKCRCSDKKNYAKQNKTGEQLLTRLLASCDRMLYHEVALIHSQKISAASAGLFLQRAFTKCFPPISLRRSFDFFPAPIVTMSGNDLISYSYNAIAQQAIIAIFAVFVAQLVTKSTLSSSSTLQARQSHRLSKAPMAMTPYDKFFKNPN